MSDALRDAQEQAAEFRGQQEEDLRSAQSALDLTRGEISGQYTQSLVHGEKDGEIEDKSVSLPSMGVVRQLGERCSMGPVRTGMAVVGPENRPQFAAGNGNSMKRPYIGAIPVAGSTAAPNRRELSILTNHNNGDKEKDKQKDRTGPEL